MHREVSPRSMRRSKTSCFVKVMQATFVGALLILLYVNMNYFPSSANRVNRRSARGSPIDETTTKQWNQLQPLNNLEHAFIDADNPDVNTAHQDIVDKARSGIPEYFDMGDTDDDEETTDGTVNTTQARETTETAEDSIGITEEDMYKSFEHEMLNKMTKDELTNTTRDIVETTTQIDTDDVVASVNDTDEVPESSTNISVTTKTENVEPYSSTAAVETTENDEQSNGMIYENIDSKNEGLVVKSEHENPDLSIVYDNYDYKSVTTKSANIEASSSTSTVETTTEQNVENNDVNNESIEQKKEELDDKNEDENPLINTAVNNDDNNNNADNLTSRTLTFQGNLEDTNTKERNEKIDAEKEELGLTHEDEIPVIDIAVNKEDTNNNTEDPTSRNVTFDSNLEVTNNKENYEKTDTDQNEPVVANLHNIPVINTPVNNEDTIYDAEDPTSRNVTFESNLEDTNNKENYEKIDTEKEELLEDEINVIDTDINNDDINDDNTIDTNYLNDTKLKFSHNREDKQNTDIDNCIDGKCLMLNENIMGEEMGKGKDECESCFKHNFKYVIDNKPICDLYPHNEEIYLLILVTSAHEHYEQRNALRNTWLKHTVKNTGNVRYVFLLGSTDNPYETNAVLKENLTHKDIVKEAFMDTYNNLTHKTIMGMKWASTRCGKAKFVMKTDDDVYVNIDALLTHIKKNEEALQHHIGGTCNQMSKSPIRDPASKWFVPRKTFMYDRYPSFCSGTAYFMGMNVAKTIYSISSTVPFFHLEDVYVGLCLRKAGFSVIDIPGVHLDRPKVDLCWYKTRLVTVHLMTPTLMYQTWEKKCD